MIIILYIGHRRIGPGGYRGELYKWVLVCVQGDYFSQYESAAVPIEIYIILKNY